MAKQGDIRENSGLSLLFALWICRGLRGKWLSLLIALFLQRNAIKWWKSGEREQNCNKITLMTIFLFISGACLSIWKWGQVKDFILLNGSFCLPSCFPKLNDITGSNRRVLTLSKNGNFVHLEKSLLTLYSKQDQTNALGHLQIFFGTRFGFTTLKKSSRERMWNMRHSAIMSFQLLPSHSYAEQTCKYHICRHIGHFFHYVWCKVHCSSQQHLLFNIESLVIPRYLLEFFLVFLTSKICSDFHWNVKKKN